MQYILPFCKKKELSTNNMQYQEGYNTQTEPK